MANKGKGIGLLGAGRIGKLHGEIWHMPYQTQTSTQWLIRS